MQMWGEKPCLKRFLKYEKVESVCIYSWRQPTACVPLVFLFFQSDTYIIIKGDVVSDWKSCLASIFYIIQKI